MNFKFTRKTTTTTTILFLLLSLTAINFCKGNSNSGPWIWKIDGKKFYLGDFEAAHKGSIELAKQQLAASGAPIDNIEELIKDPSKISEPQIRQLLESLQKENSLDRFKNLALVNIEADASGFSQRADIKSKVDFLVKSTIAQLYVAEQLKTADTEVTDAEAALFCQELRKRNKQYRRLPADQCIQIGKRQVLQQKMRRAQYEGQAKVMDSIKEKFTIVANKDFDLKAYLAKDTSTDSVSDKDTSSDSVTDKKDTKKKK